jgi:hypothetical protein
VEQDWFDIQRWSKKKGYDAENREKPKAIAPGTSRRHYLVTKHYHFGPLGFDPEIRKKRADHVRKAGRPSLEENALSPRRTTPSGTFEPEAWIDQ